MSRKYLRARDAALFLRDALHPRSRPPRERGQADFKADRQRIRDLFTDPNLLGFAVAEKNVSGKSLANQFCLTFFVRRKLQESRLPGAARIPKRLTVRTLGTTIPTDVRELRQMHVAHNGIRAGSSIGHVSGTSGTITLITKDLSTGAPLILSCSHVLARGGYAQEGDAVESPASPNGTSLPNVIGHLTDRFMVIDPQKYNTFDAALAQPINGIDFTNDIPGVGTPSGVLDLNQLTPEEAMNLPVEKFGARTSLQSGKITGLHATLQIRFPELGDRVVWFTDLVTHDLESEQGDSGAALIASQTRQIVGMHIAGSGGSGCCTNIQPVLNMLQTQI
jgi:hypothetical protein